MNNIELMFKGDTGIQNNLVSFIIPSDEKISKQVFQERLFEKADKILENLFPIKSVSQICNCKFDSSLDVKDKCLSMSELVFKI